MTRIPVIIDEVLGVRVARGFASISFLSAVSKADVYDEDTNPQGTQRDLSKKHARDAYEYILRSEFAYLPEVFLSLRESSIISITPSEQKAAYLDFDDDRIKSSDQVFISRVDGNHRLHYADGHDDKYPAIDKVVSFCMALDLSREEEIRIFKDINDNQRKMNTSHLDNITIRLMDPAKLRQDRDLFISNALADDKDSPFFGVVHRGGKKDAQRFIGLRNIKSGVKYMFSESAKLSALGDIEAQTILIKNYFNALLEIYPEAWEKPRKSLLLRGAGFWGACYLGADVIDRCILQGKFSKNDMKKVLKSGREWDWSNEGDFRGYSGASGSKKIKDLIVSEFEEDGKVSIKDLVKQIAKSS